MENPFPGMNPWLEDPRLWPGVHQRLITYLAETINAQLPPNYVADIDERIYVEKPERARVVAPDITVTRTSTSSQMREGVATLLADSPLLIELEPLLVHEPFIQILSLRNGIREVVTVIEVLSPANKTPGSEGHTLYLSKQGELLNSMVSLVEIDLLHLGEHTVAVPLHGLEPYRPWDYIVSLHRGGIQRWRFEVWLARLKERLPRISVPLIGDDPDVVVDLQAVLNKVYVEGRYERLIDYYQEPPIPLAEEVQRWLREQLKRRAAAQ
jgi:hypothetical protein